jgi:hypothetical protein
MALAPCMILCASSFAQHTSPLFILGHALSPVDGFCTKDAGTTRDGTFHKHLSSRAFYLAPNSSMYAIGQYTGKPHST